MTMRALCLVAMVGASCSDRAATPVVPARETWKQWGGSAEHTGAPCVAAQPMARKLTTIRFDMLVDAEKSDANGNMLVHYQTPLTVGDDLYMMRKDGVYTPCPTHDSHGRPRDCAPYRKTAQSWSEKGTLWQANVLVER